MEELLSKRLVLYGVLVCFFFGSVLSFDVTLNRMVKAAQACQVSHIFHRTQ